MDIKQQALKLHKKFQGKIETVAKIKIKNKKDLSLVYTPGVAAVSSLIAQNPNLAWEYTLKGRTVAIVSDGSAVLGLGNIGPEAALPVMEGKALLFKNFAGLDAFPVCLKTQDEDLIIEIVKNLAPSFGGINLEDISAPRCFKIESSLQDLGIPVMHDDQHGTAVVVLAGLINAAKVVKKDLKNLKIVISGAGAAGTAVAKLIFKSVADIIMVDSQGIIFQSRLDLSLEKRQLAEFTNKENKKGNLQDALKGSDVFIGVSKGNILKFSDIQLMEDKAIIFALANPTPEIMPDEAKKGGAKVVATGRSDYPNQINNVLAFPGIFKGALEIKAPKITEKMKFQAAFALASLVEKPTSENIIPDPFDKKVVEAVSGAIKLAAKLNEDEIFADKNHLPLFP